MRSHRWGRALALMTGIGLASLTAVSAQTPVRLTAISPARAQALVAAAAQHLAYLPSEVVIKFKTGVNADGQQRALLALRSRPAVSELQWSNGIASYRDAAQTDARVRNFTSWRGGASKRRMRFSTGPSATAAGRSRWRRS